MKPGEGQSAPSPRPRYTRAQWAERLLTATTVAKPSGPGPFPTVIMLHGCGGLRPFMKGYEAAARSAGWAVVTVDSFRPRGLSRLAASLLVCTGLKLQGAERAADVYAMYDWVQHQTWADKRHIAAAGWSHGGWAIMDALALGPDAARHAFLSDLPPDPLRGLAGAILVYPYGGFPAATYRKGWGGAKPRVFTLLCGKDQVVGVTFPQRAMDRLERDGVKVERLILPDATHAFDDQGANDPRARYRPDYVVLAQNWLADALKSIGRK